MGSFHWRIFALKMPLFYTWNLSEEEGFACFHTVIVWIPWPSTGSLFMTQEGKGSRRDLMAWSLWGFLDLECCVLAFYIPCSTCCHPQTRTLLLVECQHAKAKIWGVWKTVQLCIEVNYYKTTMSLRLHSPWKDVSVLFFHLYAK